MITAFFEVITITFFPIFLILSLLSLARKSTKPLIGAGILFAAYSFDSFVRYLPIYISAGRLNPNWIGGVVSFFWPLTLIFLFKCFSAEEMGLKLKRPIKGIIFGLVFGLILGVWNIIDGYFLTGLPSKNLPESIFYQLLVPSFSEELIFRGLFLAILLHFLEEKPSYFGWGIILVSLLFINIHLVNFDRVTGQVFWSGNANLLGNLLIATVVLAYLRVKTESIWPCIICHGLMNSSPFIAAYFMGSVFLIIYTMSHT